MRNTNPASVGSGFFPKKIVFSFLRLNIDKKMLLGYLTLVALIFVISAFAISSLEKLNNINEVIVRTDVPLIETADRMIEYVKSIPGSVYVVDRRRRTAGEENEETIKQIATKESIEKGA